MKPPDPTRPAPSADRRRAVVDRSKRRFPGSAKHRAAERGAPPDFEAPAGRCSSTERTRRIRHRDLVVRRLPLHSLGKSSSRLRSRALAAPCRWAPENAADDGPSGGCSGASNRFRLDPMGVVVIGLRGSWRRRRAP